MKLILILLFFLSLHAHQLRENYLHVDYDEKLKTLKVVLEVETRLLENTSLMDDNHNEIISFKELRSHKPYLISYMQRHFNLFLDSKPLSLENANVDFHRYQDQTYMQVSKSFINIDLNMLVLKYSMFFELENNHKLLIHLDDERGDYILNTNHRVYNFSSFKMSLYERLWIFIQNGFSHILDGIDHLLFLLMILIPSVVLFHHNANTVKPSLIEILKVVTTFSIAHSLTLFISAMGLWRPDTTFIESSIALSIFAVALMNLFAKYQHVNKKLVFLFGLLHGFGFANVLEMAKVDSTLEFLTALLGFNLGVEFGQISVILLLLPFLYIISKTKFCIDILKLMSLVTVFISLYWFFQRVGLIKF